MKKIKQIKSKKIENGEKVDAVIFMDNSAIIISDGKVHFQEDITSDHKTMIFLFRYLGLGKFKDVEKGLSFISTLFNQYILLGNGIVIDIDEILNSL